MFVWVLGSVENYFGKNSKHSLIFEALRYCSLCMRIKLPKGAKDDFEEFSGLQLEAPEKIVGA